MGKGLATSFSGREIAYGRNWVKRRVEGCFAVPTPDCVSYRKTRGPFLLRFRCGVEQDSPGRPLGPVPAWPGKTQSLRPQQPRGRTGPAYRVTAGPPAGWPCARFAPGSGQAGRPDHPVRPHLLFLMGQDAEVRARISEAEQDEPRRSILGRVTPGLRLIHLAFEDLAGAGGTPALQAHVKQFETGPGRSSARRGPRGRTLWLAPESVGASLHPF